MTTETKPFKWRTQFNSQETHGEKFTMPSQTIPNEAMSIREILVRYSRGLPIDQKIPIYDEENDLPDPRKMDLADWQEARERYQEELQAIKARRAAAQVKPQPEAPKPVETPQNAPQPQPQPQPQP